MYISGPSLMPLVKAVNEDLSSLSNWFIANKLSLNVQKTTYIVFSNNNINHDLHITIDGKDIMQVPFTKFLGIHLDRQMGWEYHTKYVAKKVASGLYALNSFKYFMPSHILTNLYHALIHCHLSYGCQLWGNTHKKFINKIKVMQKKAIRIICHAKYNATTGPLFKNRGILKFDDICKLQIYQLMYKLYTQITPDPLCGLIPQNVNVHDFPT